MNVVMEFLYSKNNVRRMGEMLTNEADVEGMKSDDRYKQIIKAILEVSKGLLYEPDLEEDLRQQGIDSISFIQILAKIEERFDFEFGYDDIDNLKVVSVKTLYSYVTLLKE